MLWQQKVRGELVNEFLDKREAGSLWRVPRTEISLLARWSNGIPQRGRLVDVPRTPLNCFQHRIVWASLAKVRFIRPQTTSFIKKFVPDFFNFILLPLHRSWIIASFTFQTINYCISHHSFHILHLLHNNLLIDSIIIISELLDYRLCKFLFIIL